MWKLSVSYMKSTLVTVSREEKKSTLVFWLDIFSSLLWKLLGLCVCVLCCFWECKSVGLKVQMCSKWRPTAAAPSQSAALWETSSSCAHCHASKDTLEIIGAWSHSELNSDCPFWDVQMKVNFGFYFFCRGVIDFILLKTFWIWSLFFNTLFFVEVFLISKSNLKVWAHRVDDWSPGSESPQSDGGSAAGWRSVCSLWITGWSDLGSGSSGSPVEHTLVPPWMSMSHWWSLNTSSFVFSCCVTVCRGKPDKYLRWHEQKYIYMY